MSYRVVIRALGEPKDIAARVYFGTWQEAYDFGCHSINILEHYLRVEKWRVVESDQPVNHALVNGRLHRIPDDPC